MNKTPSSSRGFTLVEVLVASLILAIGLLAVATMISRSTIQDSRAYYMTKASLIVEEFFEGMIHVQYDEDDFKNMTNTAFNRVVDGVSYSTNCVIDDDAPIKNTKEMTCEVTWNNKGIQARTAYVYVFSPKY